MEMLYTCLKGVEVGTISRAEDLLAWVRERSTMYSVATAALCAVFTVLLCSDLFLEGGPRLGYPIIVTLMILSAVAALGFLVLGDRFGFWPALVIVTANGVMMVLDFTLLRVPTNTIGSVIQMPVLALYLGIFLRPAAARIIEAGVLIAVLTAAVLGHTGTDVFYGGRNLIKILLFVWLCLEAGIYAQKRFKRETHVDILTGLLNRQGLVDRAYAERARATRAERPTSVAMIDLDRFKQVNDTRGHSAGDHVLRDLAGQWRAQLRESDVIARLGGDEFVLVLPDTDVETGQRVMERLNKHSSHPWSWGLVEWQPDEKLSHVVANADREMYRDKATRREPADR
ncbi:diguanylate cyclase [Leucobacter muris]|uniref:Diguanylate cyclase n=1 Tax=Leucobacter muris TaxID=1935379 RepID=A0ABX5QH04_9MICO|nr:diguanylate cyclase [Leucobacter muris]